MIALPPERSCGLNVDNTSVQTTALKPAKTSLERPHIAVASIWSTSGVVLIGFSDHSENEVVNYHSLPVPTPFVPTHTHVCGARMRARTHMCVER